MISPKKFRWLQYSDYIIQLADDGKSFVARSEDGNIWQIPTKDGWDQWTLGSLHDYIKDAIAEQIDGGINGRI